jgi:hypothetical protein
MPSPAKSIAIIAQVESSGTAGETGSKMLLRPKLPPLVLTNVADPLADGKVLYVSARTGAGD